MVMGVMKAKQRETQWLLLLARVPASKLPGSG
jgi:hypothetical protein